MCGIVGYVGPKQATPLLVAGLRKLEYRGYDSAGLAVTDAGRMQVVRCRGKLSALEEMVAKEPPPGSVGIGHTRWATHGRPSDENAHPHKTGSVAVVHNGIIENHLALRARLEASGRKFSSETDTEIVAHLIDEALGAGAPTLVAAVRAALAQVEGAYALAVVSREAPGPDRRRQERVAAVRRPRRGRESSWRRTCPRSSSTRARSSSWTRATSPRSARAGVKLTNLDGTPVQRPTKTITWDAAAGREGRLSRTSCSRRSTSSRAPSPTRCARA